MKKQITKDYPSDISDKQWNLIFSLLPQPKSAPGKPGRPASTLRTVVNGILYM